jgi:hypothetical protein
MSRSLIFLAFAAVLASAKALPLSTAPIVEAAGNSAEASARYLQEEEKSKFSIMSLFKSRKGEKEKPAKEKSAKEKYRKPPGASSFEPPSTDYASMRASVGSLGGDNVMSAKFAKNFKQMVGWWCQKEENKSKNLCKLHAVGTSSMEELQKQASLSESKEAANSYCSDPTYRARIVCVQPRAQGAAGGKPPKPPKKFPTLDRVSDVNDLEALVETTKTPVSKSAKAAAKAKAVAKLRAQQERQPKDES